MPLPTDSSPGDPAPAAAAPRLPAWYYVALVVVILGGMLLRRHLPWSAPVNAAAAMGSVMGVWTGMVAAAAPAAMRWPWHRALHLRVGRVGAALGTGVLVGLAVGLAIWLVER